jgi:hypothetical protein
MLWHTGKAIPLEVGQAFRVPEVWGWNIFQKIDT